MNKIWSNNNVGNYNFDILFIIGIRIKYEVIIILEIIVLIICLF